MLINGIERVKFKLSQQFCPGVVENKIDDLKEVTEEVLDISSGVGMDQGDMNDKLDEYYGVHNRIEGHL